MTTPTTRVLPDAEGLAGAAAEVVLATLQTAIDARGSASFVLAGGHTPVGAYRTLAARGRQALPWDRVQFFWGDERMVAPTHPASNHRMARHELLAPLGIDAAAVHPVDTECGSATTAAEDYERRLRDALRLDQGEVPHFDLVLLGLGEDGHTASLMPGCTAALAERERLTATCCLPRLEHDRVTLTLPALNAARTVVFLVSGDAKAAVLHRVLHGPFQPDSLPAQAVRPTLAEPLWLVDRAAAGTTAPA